jgi:hypothetical protein
MPGPSFHDFRMAGRSGERLVIVDQRVQPCAEGVTGQFGRSLLRWVEKVPGLNRLDTVAACRNRRRDDNVLAWQSFSRALAEAFGAAAAKLALDGLNRDPGADLTGREIRVAHLYVIGDHTARRRYCVADPALAPPRLPRKFREADPHPATKSGFPDIRLNHAVAFAGGDNSAIQCRHLAVAWELEFLANHGKVPYQSFRTAPDIQRSLPPGADAAADARRFRASVSKQIVRHADWGREMAANFREMEQNGECLRTLYVMSCSHLMSHGMALGFKIRTDPRTPQARGYVVNFYDPNNTASHVRAAVVNDPAHLERLTAEDFFRQTGIDPTHYYDYPISWFFSTASHPTQARRFPDEFLVPYAMWDALRMNQAAAIAECRPRFEQLTLAERAGFLCAIVDGTPGLYWALQQGHAEAIAAWGELLMASNLSAEAKAELLAASSGCGHAGIRFAKPPAIAAWERLVAQAGLSGSQQQRLRAELAQSRTAVSPG